MGEIVNVEKLSDTTIQVERTLPVETTKEIFDVNILQKTKDDLTAKISEFQSKLDKVNEILAQGKTIGVEPVLIELVDTVEGGIGR